ncbi:hypothetical protein GCM10027404_26540 [Arthrobacter tumbae]|uniref:small multidrug efflux protein n=1 Tax=Arthrobacter tumbae TaxID=163874 RepID=UPI00195D2D82|nr:small multidrug efflux protein [Arthrobacter tumbae]MBM7781677.1 hypothetical protein [Arthrobacter tumbae]
MSNPYEGLQDFVATVPELIQPLIIAAAAAVPYIEGEGSAALGIIAGVNPFVAAVAGAAGNIICVVLVVLLSSRVREAAVARRTRNATGAGAGAGTGTGTGTATILTEEQTTPEPQSKGRRRLGRWLVRFGVPGASLLAPLALPTQLTAATFVASGVRKGWVILWQIIAIVIWTGLVAAAATGLLTVITG